MTSYNIIILFDSEPVFKQSSVVNATRGIADPSVFTPPTSCNTPSSGNDEVSIGYKLQDLAMHPSPSQKWLFYVPRHNPLISF